MYFPQKLDECLKVAQPAEGVVEKHRVHISQPDSDGMALVLQLRAPQTEWLSVQGECPWQPGLRWQLVQGLRWGMGRRGLTAWPDWHGLFRRARQASPAVQPGKGQACQRGSACRPAAGLHWSVLPVRGEEESSEGSLNAHFCRALGREMPLRAVLLRCCCLESSMLIWEWVDAWFTRTGRHLEQHQLLSRNKIMVLDSSQIIQSLLFT